MPFSPMDAQRSICSSRASLLRLGAQPPHPAGLERAFAERRVPLTIVTIADPAISTLYERALVLVRPDGHVAWRDDQEPADPGKVVDHIRGAGREYVSGPPGAP